ncbi:MAG: hypothetical protein JWN78_3156 [Bacteroidota bacterium]|nr:hypothetical protein [Bacteroidota bacterium]
MSDQVIHQKFIDNKICVIIPTYNNEQTLKNVIDSVLEYTSNVLVVNDGSTDSTTQILSNYKSIKISGYEKNRGKGFALRYGFKEAVKLGYNYAITIDSDGQHFAKDLPLFINKLEETGRCLIIGARNMDQASVPGKSNFGNKFSNFWYWAETGIKMPDTQSGYRLYPISIMNEMIFFTRRFEFEIESIVRVAWKGIKIEWVPVSVYYSPKETRITHFRPLQDFTRISILNTFLFIAAILFFHPYRFFKKIFSVSTYREFITEIKNSEHSRLMTALSVSLGVFTGILPIWGFQLIVALFLAILFRLNKALVLIFSNISIPPMIPLIIFLSYKLGQIWLGDKAIHFVFSRNITIEAIKMNITQYLYGSIALAIIAAIVFGILSYLLLAFYKKETVNE